MWQHHAISKVPHLTKQEAESFTHAAAAAAEATHALKVCLFARVLFCFFSVFAAFYRVLGKWPASLFPDLFPIKVQFL